MNGPISLEMCAGAGGQALGLERAGFEHTALVEIDKNCCETLHINRPGWNIFTQDLNEFDGRPYKGIDLLAGGLPCPPFSVAGKQLGIKDERNLFPAAIRLIDEIKPRAIMIENVRGILGANFENYRNQLSGQLRKMGYESGWSLFNASDFGVPQLRPRAVFVAIKKAERDKFSWPSPIRELSSTVGETLLDLMALRGWKRAKAWSKLANTIAPTIVGGSKKHGGPDLGPTRAKKAWATLGVDGHGLADEPPSFNFVGAPRLTVEMVTRLQGFPDSWKITGKKTAAYRQIGNAFPPPVAFAVATEIYKCLTARHLVQVG